MQNRNILILAPHPDDEVLGCGATMKKLSDEGNQLFVLVVTRGSSKFYSDEKIQNVRTEALQAHKLLGVGQTFFLDFPAPELDTVSLAEISKEISKVLYENKISVLYLPHRGDIHNDHRVVFNAGLVAARPVGDYSVEEIYAYETLSETEWAAPFGDDAFIPTCFVNVEKSLNTKMEAMKCFKSQLKTFPNPRSLETIEALAKFRGATVGFKAAEAFMVIRQIIK
ncbi:PIG-L family deacetylase [bacterium]|nr:PIG-L family deacetylase [bacterium]